MLQLSEIRQPQIRHVEGELRKRRSALRAIAQVRCVGAGYRSSISTWWFLRTDAQHRCVGAYARRGIRTRWLLRARKPGRASQRPKVKGVKKNGTPAKRRNANTLKRAAQRFDQEFVDSDLAKGLCGTLEGGKGAKHYQRVRRSRCCFDGAIRSGKHRPDVKARVGDCRPRRHEKPRRNAGLQTLLGETLLGLLSEMRLLGLLSEMSLLGLLRTATDPVTARVDAAAVMPAEEEPGSPNA